MNGTSLSSVNQNTVESLKIFLQEMTTSIQNLAIRQSGVQLSNADSHMTFSFSQDNCMRGNTWHQADNEMLNGFLRHSSISLPERCCFDSRELMAPHNRMSLAASTNGGYLGYSHHGSKGLSVSNMMGNGLNLKQGPRSWHPEKPSVDAQEYQGLIEEIKKTVQTWSAKHHSLVQASQLSCKNIEAPCPTPHTGAIPLEPSWDRVLETSSHIQKENVREGSSLRETPCSVPLSEHACEGAAADASVSPLTFCKDSQQFEPPGVFTRTSRRRSLYRRRALKKVESFNSDAVESDSHSSPLYSKGTEFPSSSSGSGSTVQSPDWLPQGWVTEMKTRASGSSAGTKYKCYVDPITKRRFRTRKEVFCFLTTGNTGRYKRKSSIQQNGDCHDSDSIMYPVIGSQNTSQGPNWAGGSHVDGSSLLQKSWQYGTGPSAHGGLVNIRAAALKLLTDDDDMTLEEKARLFARFSPRPFDLYGLRKPAKNFKRMKAEGKESLEALGKDICQQGLSILRKCND